MPIELDLPIDEYHASDRLSSSKISDYINRGPRYYYECHVARTRPHELTEAMAFGQAFEDALTSAKLYEEKYAIRPEGLDGRTKAGEEWLASVGNKTALSSEQGSVIRKMVEAVSENETVARLLASSMSQVSAWCDWRGVPGLQTRPDFVRLDNEVEMNGYKPFTIDVKVCQDLNTFKAKAAGFGYHRQASIASFVLAENGTRGADHYLLACEKQAPYRGKLFVVSDELLFEGRCEWMRAVSQMSECFATDRWPLVDTQVDILYPARSV